MCTTAKQIEEPSGQASSPMSTAVAWSREEDRAFENAIALHWSDGDSSEEPWEKMAALVPTKTVQELKHHFHILEQDVSAIQAGHVPIPSYAGKEASPPPSPNAAKDRHRPAGDKRSASDYGRLSGPRRDSSTSSEGGKGGSRSTEQERRKGIPWTEDEHRLFLLGLEKFGKGDWRSIARNFVISRTPTQVASHAQKYFIRLNSMSSRDRRRSSIHDITSVNGGGGGDAAASSGQASAPITSQHAPPPDPTTKHRSVGSGAAMGVYGVPMGHPVVAAPPGHMASAVGTPVMIPPGHHHHPHYVVPVAYPVVPPSGHHS